MVKKKEIPTEADPRNVIDIENLSTNIYEGMVVISKRARKIADDEREELHNKLDEFAPSSDNLEEVFENREQIEISTYYERKPKPSLRATEDFVTGKVKYHKPGTEKDNFES